MLCVRLSSSLRLVISPVTSARHKAVVEHTARRRLARLVLPALAATAVTGTVVGASVALDSAPSQVTASRISQQSSVGTADHLEALERLEDREQRVSRSARRVTLEERPEPIGQRFTTVVLNVREEPSLDARLVTTLDFATKISITGEAKDGFAEVVWEGRAYWVAAEYLAKKKPKPEKVEEPEAPATTISEAPCPNSPEIESGITAEAVRVYRAVCAAFPSITTYGGWRGDGEHSDGRAIDIMVSGDLGWDVAEYLRANASEFGLYDIIYSQRIWTAERSAEGWRPMEDRGSTTANHYDHVHVAVY